MNQIKEDRAKECAHREAVWQQIARDKAERKLDDRMRCRRDSVQAASPSPSTTMTGGSEGLGKTEW